MHQFLPRDMWLEVFSFLKPTLIISQCSPLSHEWHNLVASINFELSFKMKNSEEDDYIDDEETDEIELCNEVGEEGRNAALEKAIDGMCQCNALKSVKKLNFSQVSLNDELVRKIAQCENFANLQSLNLYNSEISVASFKAILKSTFANSLKKLKFEGKNMEKSNCEEIEKYLEENSGQLSNLGVYYFEMGEIMKTTHHEYALELFKKAVDHKYYKAMFTIGVMYDIGPLQGGGEEAMEWYLKALNNGIAKAAVNLGVVYREGIVVKKDISKTIEYYSMADRMGGTTGMFYLSLLYFDGEGVEEDINRAMKLLKKAGSLGDKDALCRLGEIYLEGHLFEVNKEKAFYYFNKAAKLGSAKAMHHLGVMYRTGEFVEQDNEKSFRYYLKSAKLGHASAQLCVADCYENDKDDTDEAFKWYLKSALNGDTRAALYAGALLANGKKVERNLPLALMLFDRAARSGNVHALCNVGRVYEFGDETIPVDIPKAIQYYENAASMDSTRAMLNLGVLLSGNDIYRDMEKAKQYLLRGSELGDLYCKFALAELFYLLEDYENALLWINEAIEEGDLEAICTLGKWYKEGKAVPLDYSKAIELFERASLSLCDNAVEELAEMYRNGLGVEKNEEKANELMQSIGCTEQAEE